MHRSAAPARRGLLARRAACALLCAGMTAAAAPSLAASSLPTVSSGARPGPPLLYAPPPDAPQLSVQPPFAARPLLVSGSEAYRGGEYLYQDYLFDDRGADTVPGSSTRAPSCDGFAASAGDVLYPAAERFAGNAADLVELRIRPTADAVVYRVTLNSVKADTVAVVGIGIDTDRSGGLPVPWPRGAGISSPGLDRFITAWGTGGEVATLPGGEASPLPQGSVTIDATTNQMTIRVPRALMDPGQATWRYVAGTGLWSGSGWKAPRAAPDPTAEDPASGDMTEPAPGVFNLAFRFDEPQSKAPMPPYETFPGVGNWFEDKQARALKERTSGDFGADVDFAKLAARVDEDGRARPGREQARIFASSLGVPEGVRRCEAGAELGSSPSFPQYGGQLQPYLLTVPPGYSPDRPAGLTFSLHALTGTYTQYAVFSPNQLRQFGDQRGNLVVTPLSRGTDGWYTDEAEADFFEAWADVARRFSLDPERVALTGFSMGGYGTYKLGVAYPDLFGRAFTASGPPARGVWVPPAPPSTGQDTNTNPLVENVRWMPYLNWVQAADEQVPYAGPRAQQARFDSEGLRSQLWTFGPGQHYAFPILDEWAAARDFLGDARVTRDPWRVDYAFMPDADRPALGLVHDHAYWLSGLRARDLTGDRRTAPARAEIGARSLAFGEADPILRRVSSAGAGAGPAQANSVEGTDWAEIPGAAKANRLLLELENIGAGTVDGPRARLAGDRELTVRVKSDGPGRIRLDLPLPAGSTVERTAGEPVGGGAEDVALDRGGATFRTAAGVREYRILPSSAGRGAGCLPRLARVGSRGIGRIRIGHRGRQVLGRAGPPSTRTRLSYRYCVRGGGQVVVTFSRRGDARLVATTAARHRARRVGRGSRLRALRRAYPRAYRLRRGVYATSRSTRIVFGVRRGRVRYVAVADRRLIKNRGLLGFYLRRAGLR